jgi:hypothetical protein
MSSIPALPLLSGWNWNPNNGAAADGGCVAPAELYIRHMAFVVFAPGTA